MGRRLAGGPGIALAALVLLLLAPAPAGGRAAASPLEGSAHAGTARVLAAGATPAFNAPPPDSFDWATYHGADNRSGFTTVHGPGGPTDAWAPVTASSFPIRAGPVVNSSAIFVVDILGNVRALARGNGSTLWTATVWSNPTTPTLSGGLLYLGCSNGEIYALNSSTGR